MKEGRLAEKVAIVTGAAPQAEGIGNGTAAAILFAREGAKVVLVNRSEERARKLQRTIEEEGGDCMVCAADVTKAADVEQMIAKTIERYGQLNILQNNVGSGRHADHPIDWRDEEDWDAGMTTNLKSMMLCCKYSIPWMIKAGGGSIINVSSLAGAIGMSGTKDRNLTNYSTTKAGMSGFTRALAANYAEDGIRVNCIVVGMVETPLITANYNEDVLKRRRQCIPLRTAGTGWDVGWAAVYLASDESRWVTAIDLFVDGGQTHIVERPQ